MKKACLDLSIVSLVIVNLVTIALALSQGWNILTLLWVYWLQSIIIGFFNFIRILSLKEFSTKNIKINKKKVKPTEKNKLFIALFFAFHYGFFHFIYAVFLLVYSCFSSFPSSSLVSNPFSSLAVFSMGSLNSGELAFIPVMGVVFFFNHLLSFLFHKKELKKKQSIGRLMFFPYARIFPMHLVIVLGATVIQSQALLAIFLFLKMGADLTMHYIEHSPQNKKTKSE